MHLRRVSNAIVVRCLSLAATLVLGACSSLMTTAEASRVAKETLGQPILDIVCAKNGSTLLIDRGVLVTRRGVRVRVWNLTGEPVSINGLGLDFEPGVHEQLSTMPPGMIAVGCWALSKHEGPEPPLQNVVILDPDRIWVSPALECGPGAVYGSGIVDYIQDLPGAPGTPEDVVQRLKILGLRPGDSIERAGYPGATLPIVRVVREGKTVAAVGLTPSPKDGWHVDTTSSC